MADYDVYDHSDIQPNCMDLDINGQKLILGGKKCLAVLNASDPEKAGAKLYRRNKFDVNCIKFCPHNDNKQQVIASSSQYYEIYNLRQSGIQMLATGKAHSRNVTDVDWDHFNSYQFATCSVDDSVNLWDVRDCKRPAQSFNIIAGAYQVKWCRKIEHIFATAHEGDVRLWDTRKTTSPIQFIAAHLSKVLSLDWHWKNEASFVSSSLDRTVKVFDFMKPNDPEIHFSTPGPVWKARFATFGDGAVLTIPFPQVGRTEHNVSLWNISVAPAAAVVHTFGGYANVVLDFCVRNIPTNDDNVSENVVQLYTLCKDGSMRLWTIDGRMQTLCSQKSIFDSSSTKPNSFSDAVLPIDGRNFNFSNFMETFIDDNFQTAPLSSSSSINIVENSNSDNVFLGGGDQSRQKIGLEIPCSSPFNVFKMHGAPINWEKELITLSSVVLPNIMVEEINRENKTVVVLMKTKAYRPIRFRISSSLAYRKSLNDQQRQISLQFLSHPSVSTSISNNAKIQILKVFQESLSATRSDEEESVESVFEVCLKQLSGCLDQYSSENESSDTQPSTESPNAASIGELFASYINARVPFPATCGAKFCGPGYLVCFARKPESEICCGMPITQPGIVSCAISPRSYGDLLNLARERKEMQNDSQQQTYFATSIPRDPFSLSNFYYPNRQWIATRRKPRVDSATGLHYALDKVDLDDETCSDLHVYDCSKLFPFSKQSAQLYKLDTKDPASVCAQNALMLNQKGRKDLAKLWRLLDKCAERSFAKINSQFDSPWPLTPFGRKLIDQLINHYRDCGDFQTAALICCTFGSKVKMRPKSQAFGRKLSKAFGQRPLEQGSDSVYNTIHGTYGNHIRENLSAQRHRSNSFTEEAEVTSNNCNLNDDPLLTPISENGNNGHSKTASKEDSVIISPLDPTCTNKYEGIRLAYADLLHRWNFLNQRAQIMQYSRVSIERHDGVEYRMLCRTCNTECLSSSYCHSCRSSVGFSCVICKIAVKGLASICALCLHGGHTKHMLSWFQEHNKCPSGCGCTCSYA